MQSTTGPLPTGNTQPTGQLNVPTPAWYVSSTGSGLSATIGGLSVVGISQAIAVGAGLIGHPVSQDTVTAAITTIVAAVGGVYAAFGLLRKAYIAIFTKKTA